MHSRTILKKFHSICFEFISEMLNRDHHADKVRSHWTMSGCTGQSPPDSVCPVASLFLLLFNLYTGYLILNQFLHPIMQMPVKRLSKRSTHPPNSSDTSSGGGEDFIVSPALVDRRRVPARHPIAAGLHPQATMLHNMKKMTLVMPSKK
jgi:hypothetical protein